MNKVNEKEFKEIISTSTTLVFADFSADWCMPCKALKKVMDKIEPDYAERVKFINCDAEECEELCNEYNIVNVPTVIMFKNGEKVDGFLGNLSRDKIIEKIEKYV